MSSLANSGQLIVPHVGDTHLIPVLEALTHAPWHGWHTTLIPVNPADDQDYWHLLIRAWNLCAAKGQDLMIVEHDIVIHHQVFESFAGCPELACVYTYWLGASHSYGLGCVRFRAALIREQPQAIRDAGELADDGIPLAGHWKRLDTRIWRHLGDPHVHQPPVRHLHRYPMPDPLEEEN